MCLACVAWFGCWLNVALYFHWEPRFCHYLMNCRAILQLTQGCVSVGHHQQLVGGAPYNILAPLSLNTAEREQRDGSLSYRHWEAMTQLPKPGLQHKGRKKGGVKFKKVQDQQFGIKCYGGGMTLETMLSTIKTEYLYIFLFISILFSSVSWA